MIVLPDASLEQAADALIEKLLPRIDRLRIRNGVNPEADMGMVGINVPIPAPMAWHPFGGWKRSRFGDHHAYGEEGIRLHTRYKSVMQCWPDNIAKGPEFSMPTAK